MRAVVQRVTQAQVTVDGRVVGAIGRGVVVLLGIAAGDDTATALWMANKIANLRIFPDPQGKSHFDRSLQDIGGAALVVSQFTLYGDARKGRRPSFSQAAPPEVADPLIKEFVKFLQAAGIQVATGIFQAHMLVEIHNDGPVTIIIER
ncbi:MAG: D-tyrosyl-tRNA(Tyr) deacylase [Chloroflexi bacterium]|nr:D-tyrosyl-tRNA(Tyr) deacylase [Chloroflexota bacterium]